jgi:hypothetical protein
MEHVPCPSPTPIAANQGNLDYGGGCVGRASFPGLSPFNGSSQERPGSEVSMPVPVLGEFYERPGFGESAFR